MSFVWRLYLKQIVLFYINILDPSLSSSKENSLLLGIKPFMNQLDELLNQEQARGGPQGPSAGITISMTPKANALELLLVGSHPVSPNDMEAHTKLLANQEQAFRYA